ncbi:MAG TPA: hypothetical protein VK702_00505 [Candidatus Acidoferrum sp.]|jgi:hypothetical protein|nr:hypothetical protein [Candidatus Acidoferrum sp.]
MGVKSTDRIQSFGTPAQSTGRSASATVSETVLEPLANVLTPADLALISAATGAQFQSTPQGLQMVQWYSPGVPINGDDYMSALSTVKDDLKKHGDLASPTAASGLALGEAEFRYAKNFTNAIISTRNAIGPTKAITPPMVIDAAKHANASGATVPEAYVANAIGYLNGIALE